MPVLDADVLAPRSRRRSRSDWFGGRIWLVTLGCSVMAAAAVTASLGLISTDLALLLGASSVLLAFRRGVFRTRMVPDTTSMVMRLIRIAVVASVVVYVGSDLFGLGEASPAILVGLISVFSVASVAGMFLASQLLARLWAAGYGRSRVVVVGDGALTNELLLELRHRPSYGVDVVGVVGDSTVSSAHVRLSGGLPRVGLSGLAGLLQSTGADRVFITPSDGDERDLVAAGRVAAAAGLPVFVVPRLFEMGVGLDSVTPDRLRGYPLVRVQRADNVRFGLRMKRAFDSSVSLALILASSPVMLLCAIAVRLSGPGPVLFHQERVGQDGRPITVSKFRSMRESSRCRS